ncbi:hypothetical protein SCLCIDRAFT_33233 [Scleroderma citrinum Foug A]|uniref:Uncharacterized protein n=1 Tax=Scleroderma citrinum Foug A TaxID=1036808 RepID=A0A0C3CT09_9AGAM|nr:hypothetical protein SCLCIDRAFT_33233 [Scleroderma citrinum Foug A]
MVIFKLHTPFSRGEFLIPSIAAAPPFPGLRCFPQGRGFKQWTGNDSKALMKVFLPAIVHYVPNQMVQAIAAFLDFCYIVH